MKTNLRIVRYSYYYLNKDKNEYDLMESSDHELYIKSNHDSVISKVRDWIQSSVRRMFEVGDEISEESYDVNNEDLKMESSLHPVLEYRFKYRRRIDTTKRGRANSLCVWEVYYMEIDSPNVADTYKI